MLKYLLLLFLIPFTFLKCISQEVSFEFSNTQTRTQFSNFCIQNSEEHYILTSYDLPGSENELYIKSKIFDLDVNGVLVNENEYEVANSNLKINSIIEQPNYYIVLGEVNNLETDSNYVWFAKINFDLDIIEEKLVSLNNLNIGPTQSFIIGDEIFSVGYGSGTDYAFKLSLNGELLNLNDDLNAGLFRGNNSMIFNDVSNTFFVFGFNLLEMDLNLNVLNSLEPSPFGLRPQGYILAHTDSTYILCGKKHYWDTTNERSIGIGISNFNHEELAYQTIGSFDKVDYPAYKRSLSKNDLNEIYCGGTFNIFTSSTEFVLAKFDEQLNPLWEHTYSTTNRSEMMGLITTADNGCLMYGFSVESTIDGPLSSIYVIKVDHEGTVDIKTTIPIDKLNIKVFPNPTANFLNIELPELITNTQLEIQSINGQVIYSQLLQDEQSQIDVKDFPNGSYLVLLKDKKGKLISSQKFVKQSAD